LGVGVVPPDYCYCFSFVLPNRGHITKPKDEGVMVAIAFETYKIKLSKGMVGVAGTTFKGCSKCQNLEVYSTNPCDTITLC
jgi:hypothetical protein